MGRDTAAHTSRPHQSTGDIIFGRLCSMESEISWRHPSTPVSWHPGFPGCEDAGDSPVAHDLLAKSPVSLHSNHPWFISVMRHMRNEELPRLKVGIFPRVLADNLA